MNSDIIGENLSITEEEKNLEKKPSEREEEFAKVAEVFEGARNAFLTNKDMPIEAAITGIQTELAKLLPKPGPTPASTMDAIAGTRPPGLGMLGR